jgi:hypothetical protein
MPNLAPSPRARTAASSAAVLVVALLSGCGPAPGGPTASPSPEPRFASDEEAYEAAIAVYTEYAKVSSEISSAGGEGAERLLDFADRDYSNQLLREVHAMQEKGLRIIGAGTFEPMGLESIDTLRSELAVRMCLGIGDSRIVDAAGQDVTPQDRDAETAVLVSFTTTEDARVLISGSDSWSGEDFC